MKVEITTPPGIFAEGSLERILSQHGAPYPHIVIEMKALRHTLVRKGLSKQHLSPALNTKIKKQIVEVALPSQ
jgi:hypothetical protein